MQGRIMKGIAGFYYVEVPDYGLYECKAKGSFRNQKLKPLPGDLVDIEVLDPEKMTGNVVQIYPRKNELIRPAVANVDQVLIEFAAAEPNPNLNLLDRFLILMNRQQVKTIVCFNKVDLVEEEMRNRLAEVYAKSGNQVCFTSTYSGEGIAEIKQLIAGKTTVLAGPSGVGKSSLLNCLLPEANAKTGEISEKIKRGKHTTRHSEILPIGPDTYLMDTPGFSSIYFYDLEPEELKQYYREFEVYEPYCRFGGCNHVGERECGVKQAVADGEIARSRYENYCLFFEELKDKRKY